MLRPRRKSFYIASQRIFDYSNSTNATKSKDHSPETKLSNKRQTRSKSRTSPVIDDNTSTKRKTNSSKIDSDVIESATTDLVLSSPLTGISAEWPKVQLNRLSQGTINLHLNGIQNLPEFQSMSCNSQKALKIMKRRCTVNLVREDFTKFDENLNQSQPGFQSMSSNSQKAQKIMKRRWPVNYVREFFDENLNRVEQQSQQHITSQHQIDDHDDVLSTKNSPEQPNDQDEISTFYESDNRKVSNISYLIKQPSLHNDDETDAQFYPMSADFDAILKCKRMKIQDDATTFYESIGGNNANTSNRNTPYKPVNRLSLLRPQQFVDDTDDDSDSDEEIPIQSTQAIVPFRTQQFRTSQTVNYIPWRVSTSTMGHSTSVQYQRSQIASPNAASLSETKKCFIDSSDVMYGSIVNVKNNEFAVNCFDHGNPSIKHHFISKFDRTLFESLRSFNHDLWVSEITGSLIKQYSLINKERIHILNYNEPVEINDVTVTAIEVPRFPGGTLFLFQATNEKSIIHVSDFRLPIELESNDSLINTQIKKVQFDQSMLSKLFYQYPPCSDRYLDLHNEIYEFIDKSRNNGLLFLIAIGAFEIGMEHFIYELALSFSYKVYMSEKRREFLTFMNNDGIVQKLCDLLVKDPEQATIHILQVDEITYDFLTGYISKYNFISVLGIRPRGCGVALQTVIDGGLHKIVDIANPLIGDTEEYDRFVKMIVW